MIALVLLLLAAEPDCAADSDCQVSTRGTCCQCCPAPAFAAPKKKESTRCEGIACPARACTGGCKKVDTEDLAAVCRESRCVLEKAGKKP